MPKASTACSPRAGWWQGIRLFPFHGVKGTCSLAGCGAAPHDLLAKTGGGVWGALRDLATAAKADTDARERAQKAAMKQASAKIETKGQGKRANSRDNKNSQGSLGGWVVLPIQTALAGYFLPYQVAWLNDPARLKIWEKSRRSSATDVQADVRDCAKKGGCDVWFTSADQATSKEYIRYCADWARILNAVAKDMGEVA